MRDNYFAAAMKLTGTTDEEELEQLTKTQGHLKSEDGVRCAKLLDFALIPESFQSIQNTLMMGRLSSVCLLACQHHEKS